MDNCIVIDIVFSSKPLRLSHSVLSIHNCKLFLHPSATPVKSVSRLPLLLFKSHLISLLHLLTLISQLKLCKIFAKYNELNLYLVCDI